LQGEFDPHRHLRGKASVRQFKGAEMILLYSNLLAEHGLLIYNQEYIDAPNNSFRIT
jgi:hypothetical protein